MLFKPSPSPDALSVTIGGSANSNIRNANTLLQMKESEVPQLHRILQKVLGSYIDGHKSFKSSLSKADAQHITMRIVCEKLNITGVIPSLIISHLREDGYIERNKTTADGEPFLVTVQGRKFWDAGGYFKEVLVGQQQDQIRTETIAKFKKDKVTFWMSVIGVPVTLSIGIIGLILNWQAKSETTEQKKQLHSLELQVSQQRITLDSLGVELNRVDSGRIQETMLFDSLQAKIE